MTFMKYLKVFLALLFLPAAAQSVFAQNDGIAAVEKFISEQSKTQKVEEYKYARKIERADVNADNKEDLIVFYTLKGFKSGLGYVQYLAVFLGGDADFRYADQKSVSGIVERQIELKPFENATIRLETLEYFKKSDTHYRKIGELKFVFSGGKLKEM